MGVTFKNKNRELHVRSGRVRIGTFGGCELSIEDPLAARIHCVLTVRGAGLTLEPQATSTGTYVNGREVRGPQELGPTDEVIMGTTRLTIEAASEPGTLVAILHERDFFHVEKRRGEFKSDADERVRSEVKFGRSWTMRGTIALTLVAVVAAIAYGVTQGQDRARVWASPGPLGGAHGPLFGQGSTGADHGWSEEHLAAAALGCAACHDSTHDGDIQPGVRCDRCHGDLVSALVPGGRHPFASGRAGDCASCHRVHGGAGELKRPFDPSCTSCHAHDGRDESALLAALGDTPPFTPASPSTDAPAFELARFLHADHDQTSCDSCHGASSDGRAYGVPVGSAACFDCHGASDDPAKGDAFRLTAAAHAEASTMCAGCHDDPSDGRLAASLQLDHVPAMFSAPSPHGQGDPSCSHCHLRPMESLGSGGAAAPFDHGAHMDLSGTPDDFQAGCTDCHQPTGGDGESRWVPVDVAGRCVACHPSIAPPAPAADTPAAVDGPRFSHDIHGALACADCHRDHGGEPPQVVRAAASCTDCHFEQDRHLGPGRMAACQSCHVSLKTLVEGGAFSEERRSDAIAADPQHPGTGSMRQGGFNHANPGHSSRDCSTCHQWDEGEFASESPVTVDPVMCRDCHFNTRIHWR